jgi:hypothetical protein
MCYLPTTFLNIYWKLAYGLTSAFSLKKIGSEMHSMTQNSFVEGEVLVTTIPGKRSSGFRPSNKEIGTAFRHKNTPGDDYNAGIRDLCYNH